MKHLPKIILSLLLGVLLMPLIGVGIFSVTVGAADNVIYIADGATGDGSSADSPLCPSTGNYDPAESNPRRYLDSALYQAVERLSQTGGTVVICGEVKLDASYSYGTGTYTRDFLLPNYGKRQITFTSFYNGVDYRESNGARLVIETPATLTMGGFSVFKNIDIATKSADDVLTAEDRMIAAGGHDLYMDVGVNTYVLDRFGNKVTVPENNYYLSICGGNRYGNATGSPEIVIKSGTYHHVVAGPYGLGNTASGILTGSPKVKITNGVFLGFLSGTSADAPTQSGKGGTVAGNTSFEISGGLFYDRILACSPRGYQNAGSTFSLKISGGLFRYDGLVFSASSGNGEVIANAPVSSLDLTECPDELFASLNGKYKTAAQDPAVGFASVADSTPKVIFIADNGTGDGSSPSSPLKAETVVSTEPGSTTRYRNSVLYQAALKLEDTGGTIVIVDDVKLTYAHGNGSSLTTLDFYMPETKRPITITSKYNGVDYRSTKGAELIIQNPINVILAGETTFENIDLCTMSWVDTNGTTQTATRTINADGYKATFGSGIVCRVYNEAGNIESSPAYYRYPSLAGAHRYKSTVYDTDLTVLSGSYNAICGGTFGISTANYCSTCGSINLTFGGTASVYNLYGTCQANNASAVHSGDVNITVTGGTIRTALYGVGPGGLLSEECPVTLTVTGGTNNGKYNAAYATVQNAAPSAAVADFSGFSMMSSTIAGKISGFSSILVPTSGMTYSSLLSLPTKSAYFAGDFFDPTGLSVKATGYGKSLTVSYFSTANTPFTFSVDPTSPLTAGVSAVTIYFRSKQIASFPITVQADRPVTALGAMIKTGEDSQGLRFTAKLMKSELDKPDLAYGFLLLPSSLLSPGEYLTSETLLGAEEIESTGKILRSEFHNDEYDKLYNTEDYIIFDALFDKIPIQDYKTDYTVVAYLSWTEGGKTETIYSNQIERSVYSVAKAAIAAGEEKPEVLAWLGRNVIDRADARLIGPYDASEAFVRAGKVLDYMEQMSEIVWTPSETIDFSNHNSVTGTTKYYAGTTYHGLPYTGGYGDYEQFMAQMKGSVYQTPSDYKWDTIVGNVCSTAPFAGWVRYGTSINSVRGTSDMMPAKNKGFYPVGEYKWEGFINNPTIDVIYASGTNYTDGLQTIYRAYSLLDVGDMVVSRWISAKGEDLGHIRLVAEPAHMVYNADGTVNASESTIKLTEQTSGVKNNMYGPTTDWYTNWKVNGNWKLSDLVSTSTSTANSAKYIPITIGEFRDGYFEKCFTVVKNLSSADSVKNGLHGTVLSTYDIVSLTAEIRKGSTVVASKNVFYRSKRQIDLSFLLPASTFTSLSSGSYTLTLKGNIGGEERTLVTLPFTK